MKRPERTAGHRRHLSEALKGRKAWNKDKKMPAAMEPKMAAMSEERWERSRAIGKEIR